MRGRSSTCIVLYCNCMCLSAVGSRMLGGFSTCIVLYVFVCLGSRMRGGSSTCIVLYVFVCCRFSNARGFLDMYCMCLSV